MSFSDRVRRSRWFWLFRGLPSPARASALFRVNGFTMTTPARCRVLWNECQRIFRSRVPGVLVECGVWRGGSAAVMALAMRHAGERREMHLFDSFQGLPEPTEIDEQAAANYSEGRASGKLVSIDKCVASAAEVEDLLFKHLSVPRELVHFHKGWFQDTVPGAGQQLSDIAVLRLDGDWYESTRICLENLYPKISPGGVLILDDYYAWAGCRKATEEYREAHHIRDPLRRIDLDAAYWIKT